MVPPPRERSKGIALEAYAFSLPATLFCAFTTTCLVHLIVSNFVTYFNNFKINVPPALGSSLDSFLHSHILWRSL